MNWEAVGALGELIGALVVIITLVYIAIQVKYAKLAAADANRLVRSRGITDMQLFYLNNRATFNIWIKANGMVDYYQQLAEDLGLSYEEALDIDGLCLYWIWLHWGQFRSQNSPEDIKELSQTVGSFYQLPTMAYCWNHNPFARELVEKDFAEFVQQSISQQNGK